MADPASIVAVSAAVGGAAGKLTERAWDAGEKWLSNYFEDHSEAAVQSARENAAEFMADVAHRVGEIEDELKDRGTTQEEIEEALEDPDFASTLQEALLVSARTSDAGKHDILARTVAARLDAEAESLQALATRVAVETIPTLTPKQLEYLGLAAVVTRIRPHWWSEEVFNQVSDEPEAFDGLEAAARQWFGASFTPYAEVEALTVEEIWHLDAVRCATFRPGFTHQLTKTLQFPTDGFQWDVEQFLDDFPHSEMLSDVWEGGLSSLTLTPPGLLIGAHVHGSKTGSSTRINW